MSAVRIRAENVSVHLPIYNINSLSLKKNLLRVSSGGRIHAASKCLVVEALRGVSFDVEDGDRLGVIGLNGAGKSTLLRTIAGIFRPTSGAMDVSGRVAPLLELGVGMYEDASGYENIHNCGLQLGMTPEELRRKEADIAAFTELGDYLQLPIYTYSAGMRMRLSFAVATAMEAEVMVFDEVVAAGDVVFAAKCAQRFSALMGRTRIVVQATHDTVWIKRFCNKVLLLSEGRVQDFGPAEGVLATYDAIAGTG
jgi:ABC-2 type transport system ATP-binding protein/lipopolysaccharide transport system ATP-binding protein